MAKETFRQAVEAQDLAGMVAALAPDALLHSPITYTPFEGHQAIGQLFRVLLEVFEDFHYTDQLEGPNDTMVLVFQTRIGTRDIQGIDLLRFNADGLIQDFTVMVRPRSGMEALMAAVGERLPKRP